MPKGPSFIPNPTDINSFNLKRVFDNFLNKLRYNATKHDDQNQKNADPQLDPSTSSLAVSPPIQKQPHINYRKEKTNKNTLETLIELVENDIFEPTNCKRTKNNISNHERKALKDIQKDTSKTCWIRDKRSSLLYLIVIVILKRLTAKFKEVLFNSYIVTLQINFAKI